MNNNNCQLYMEETKLLRIASRMIYRFQDGYNVADMMRTVDTTQSYASKLKDIFIQEGIIDSHDKGFKRYKLTDKGRTIQANLLIIYKYIEVMKMSEGKEIEDDEQYDDSIEQDTKGDEDEE